MGAAGSKESQTRSGRKPDEVQGKRGRFQFPAERPRISTFVALGIRRPESRKAPSDRDRHPRPGIPASATKNNMDQGQL